MKEPYEKPVLNKLHAGLMNKFGASYLRHVRTDIDGVAVAELVEQHGSPLFVFSERSLRAGSRRLRQAFATRYPRCELTWSYKTNYLDAICAILHQEGETAEVVSDFEYLKSRRLGVPGNKIIFNGPYKTRRILEQAAAEKATINVDHFEEIHDLEEVAVALGHRIEVGLRLNMDTGIAPQWSRFGFNLESGQALDAVKRITAGDHLRITGLHGHIGTYILEPSAYAVAAEKMVSFAYQLEDDFECCIDTLDFGGGFPSRARLRGIYLPPDVAVPPLDAYAEALCGKLLESLRPNDFPRLVIEAGRAVVDESGFLVTSVHAAKRLPGGMRAYVLDAGVNTLFTSFWYKHRIEIAANVAGSPEDSILYGPLCMNIDVIDENVRLPPLPRGTPLVISPVGAYNTTQWMQFITYRPAVVLIGEDGRVERIREREQLDDIARGEHLPARLGLSEEPHSGPDRQTMP